MKAKNLAALFVALAVGACGGGGDSDGSSASTTPGANSSGNSGSGSTGAGSNNSSGTASPAGNDATYLPLAYQTAQGVAQQSQVVSQKTGNADVKVLAQQLSAEINVVNQQLTQVAQTNQVTITNNVTTQQQAQVNTLNTLSGAALDQAYLKDVVAAWKSLLAATRAQARQGANLQVRQTTSANLLTIEQRLASAQQLLIVLQPAEYLVDAYQDGLLEIRLGQLALQKASDARVTQFAQRMIDEHTQANAGIATLAGQKNAALPADLSPEQTEIVTQLSDFSGADFDKAYMDRNVLLHVAAVSKTAAESQQGSDADIKALAAQDLPLLQAHLQTAQSLAAGLQGSALYQLGQNLLTELQLAQFAQVRSTDGQVRVRAQQIVDATRAGYAQLIDLAQRQNAAVPLTIPAAQATAVQQLSAGTPSDFDRAVLGLINQFTSLSLQQVQALQSGVEANLAGFAGTLLTTLQSLAAQVPAGTSSTTGSTIGSTTGNGTSTTTATIGTASSGTNTTSIADTGTSGSRIIGSGP
jgi:predicted outer membrane protein